MDAWSNPTPLPRLREVTAFVAWAEAMIEADLQRQREMGLPEALAADVRHGLAVDLLSSLALGLGMRVVSVVDVEPAA